MDQQEAETRLLDTAQTLFYGRGIQAVGMDDVRAGSGVSLKRLYRTFPSKEALVTAYLERRDAQWRADLAGAVAAAAPAPDTGRVLAVFDWLAGWFAGPDFRGCAFINAFGELGATSPAVAGAAREHKDRLRAYLRGLLAEAGADEDLAEQLLLLIDGATVTAALTGSPDAAAAARRAAATLLGPPPRRSAAAQP